MQTRTQTYKHMLQKTLQELGNDVRGFPFYSDDVQLLTQPNQTDMRTSFLLRPGARPGRGGYPNRSLFQNMTGWVLPWDPQRSTIPHGNEKDFFRTWVIIIVMVIHRQPWLSIQTNGKHLGAFGFKQVNSQHPKWV